MFERPEVDEIGPVAVDDGGEPKSVPPGLRHVGDPHSGVSLRHPLAPDLETSEASHQHPDDNKSEMTIESWFQDLSELPNVTKLFRANGLGNIIMKLRLSVHAI